MFDVISCSLDVSQLCIEVLEYRIIFEKPIFFCPILVSNLKIKFFSFRSFSELKVFLECRAVLRLIEWCVEA